MTGFNRILFTPAISRIESYGKTKYNDMEKWDTHKCFFLYRKKYTLEAENPRLRPSVQKVSLKNTD